MAGNFKILEKGLILLIRGYRYCLSPLLGQVCRFYPSCSEYTEQCIHEFGILRGLGLSLRRLSKCHPWHVGGIDLVPTKRKE